MYSEVKYDPTAQKGDEKYVQTRYSLLFLFRLNGMIGVQ